MYPNIGANVPAPWKTNTKSWLDRPKKISARDCYCRQSLSMLFLGLRLVGFGITTLLNHHKWGCGDHWHRQPESARFARHGWVARGIPRRFKHECLELESKLNYSSFKLYKMARNFFFARDNWLRSRTRLTGIPVSLLSKSLISCQEYPRIDLR